MSATNEQIADMVYNMRSHCMQLTNRHDEDVILYVTYDKDTNEFYAGDCTNCGVMKEYSIQYDPDFTLDQNLEALVEEIMESDRFNEE